MIKAFSIAAAVLALTIGSTNAQADGGPGAATSKNTTSPNGMARRPVSKIDQKRTSPPIRLRTHERRRRLPAPGSGRTAAAIPKISPEEMNDNIDRPGDQP